MPTILTGRAGPSRTSEYVPDVSLFLLGHPSEGLAFQDKDLRTSFLPNLNVTTARSLDQVPSFTESSTTSATGSSKGTKRSVRRTLLVGAGRAIVEGVAPLCRIENSSRLTARQRLGSQRQTHLRSTTRLSRLQPEARCRYSCHPHDHKHDRIRVQRCSSTPINAIEHPYYNDGTHPT